MNDEQGIYILITPTEKDNKEEYRVTKLDASHTNWTFSQQQIETLNPTEVKSEFKNCEVFSDEYDAQAEADRLADNLCLTNAPVYKVYVNTPFPKWGVTQYAKKNSN